MPALPRIPRRPPWPASKLTALDLHDMKSMARLTGFTTCDFLREAIHARLASEHARLFPDVPTPWHAPAAPVPGDVARRAAEGGP